MNNYNGAGTISVTVQAGPEFAQTLSFDGRVKVSWEKSEYNDLRRDIMPRSVTVLAQSGREFSVRLTEDASKSDLSLLVEQRDLNLSLYKGAENLAEHRRLKIEELEKQLQYLRKENEDLQGRTVTAEKIRQFYREWAFLETGHPMSWSWSDYVADQFNKKT